nr:MULTISPECIES: hypothetical protein [Streptomyces]
MLGDPLPQLGHGCGAVRAFGAEQGRDEHDRHHPTHHQIHGDHLARAPGRHLFLCDVGHRAGARGDAVTVESELERATLTPVEIPLGRDDAVPDERPRDVEQQPLAELPALRHENAVDGLRRVQDEHRPIPEEYPDDVALRPDRLQEVHPLYGQLRQVAE